MFIAYAIGPRAVFPLVAAPAPRCWTPDVFTPFSGYPLVFGTGIEVGFIVSTASLVLFCLAIVVS